MSGDAPHDLGDWSPIAAADGLSITLWDPLGRRLRQWTDATGLDGIGLLAVALLAGAVAFLLFWGGHFGLGLVAAVAFLVFEEAGAPKGWIAWAHTVLPLLWWWAWSHGLAVAAHPLAPVYGLMVLWAAVAAGAADMAIAKRFERRFSLAFSDWRRLDNRFALVAAGPSINIAVLAVGYILGRPGAALVVVAWWSIVTVIFHAVRYANASEQQARGKAITRWRQQ
jgi:hypothetical protein